MPYEDRHDFQQLAMDRFDLFGGTTAPFGAMSASLDYFREVVRAQRHKPGDGLLGMIVREHGDSVDDEELAGLADGVLTGGFETTASTIALGSLVLLQNEDVLDRLRTDDTLTAPFVEEVLRYLSAVQMAFPRFAREDIEIAGVVIPRGDMVLCSLSGANRDPSYVTDDGGFDPHRTTPASTIWPSATASTAASAPSWHAWNCAWRTPHWPGGSPACGSPCHRRISASGNCRSSTASSHSRCICAEAPEPPRTNERLRNSFAHPDDALLGSPHE